MSSYLNKSSNNALGGSDLSVYVTDPIQEYVETQFQNLDEAISQALDKIIDENNNISYEPKSLADISTSKPNQAAVQMNDKRLENLATVPDITSIDAILATPKTACNVTTTSNLITLNLALNTAYCGPLFSTMDVKDKRVTNMADALLVIENDPDGASKVKQGVNYATLNMLALTTAPEDRENYYAGGKQIKEGIQATDNGDFVVKEQTIVEEVKELQYQVEQVVVGGPYRNFRFEDSETVYTCSDPKSDPTGLLTNFVIKDTNPIQTLAKNKQVANLKYVDNKAQEEANKRHSKTQDVDLTNTYRVINMPRPSASHHGVNRSYCDSNSGKSDDPSLTGLVGFIGGLLGGAASALGTLAASGITSTFGNLGGLGLAALGSIASGVMNAGMRVGSAADWANAKPSQSAGTKQLIDNLQDDIANGGSASGDASNGGQLFNGASLFDGLVRMSRNAQIGLFELV